MITVDDLTRVIFEGAYSADNRWFAGIALGHEPSTIEAIAHFLNHGGYQWACKICGIPDHQDSHTAQHPRRRGCLLLFNDKRLFCFGHTIVT